MGDRKPHALPYSSGPVERNDLRTTSDARDSLLIGLFGPIVAACLGLVGLALTILFTVILSGDAALPGPVSVVEVVVAGACAALYPAYGLRTSIMALRDVGGRGGMARGRRHSASL